MVAVKPATTKGPQTRQVPDLHTKDGPWRGMQPDNNPAVLPDKAIRLAINCRYRGDVMPRKGQHLYNATPLVGINATIPGMIDFQLSTRRSLYIVSDGCPGLSSTVGTSVSIKDWEMEPILQPAVYYDTSTYNAQLGIAFGDLFVATDNTLRKFQLVDGGYTEPALAIAGPAQDIPIFTFTGYAKVTFLMGFDGQLFIGLDNAGASAVFAFDSVTMHTNELLGLAAFPTGAALIRDLLVIGFGGAPNNIRVRTAGASPGSWSTVAPGAGTITWRDAVSYRDALYITTGVDGNVWKYDPTAGTLAIFHTFPAGPGTPLSFNCEVHNNLLYVTWANGVGVAQKPYLAKYDGASNTWTDVEKDFQAQFSVAPKPTIVGPLRSYRGNLECGVALGDPSAIYTSPGDNTSGTYDRNIASGAHGQIDSFLVY